MTISIRKAGRSEFPALQAIELASFETLRAAGAVTGEPSSSTDKELRYYVADDLLYAAFDENGIPVGYGGAYEAEGWLHIGEIDVHPNWQRQGIGRRLVEALLHDGRTRGLEGATLTTDRLAPFNAPFYASMGFRLAEGLACPPRLRSILATETENGLDPDRRVAMMLIF